MKRIAIILILISVVCAGYAQKPIRKNLTTFLNIEGVLLENYDSYKKGTPVRLTNVIKLRNQKDKDLDGIMLAVSINHEQVAIPSYKAKILDLKPENVEDFWMCTFIRNEMFDHYESKGYRNELRWELTEEADVYLENLGDLFYEDAYIEDYIRTIFTGIVPKQLIENRPERPNIEILKSPAPDSYMLPNGTLMITTGLLSALDSVEELTAIIASEVAHFVLDHQLINTAKEISRARRAVFWGEMLSAFAEGVNEITYESGEYHIAGGAIIVAAETAKIIINTAAVDRLGMLYSKKQLEEADKVAVEFLRANNMNTSALSSALAKVKEYYETEKDYYAISKYGNFGDIDQRLAKLETPQEFANRAYMKTISGVNTFNAIIQQNSKNFAASEKLVLKNLDNNLATDDDYVIYVKSNMSQTNSPEDNERNLAFIQKAKEMSLVPNLNLYKQEILLLLRMNRQSKATEVIKEYVDLLKEHQKHTESSSEFDWAVSEISWANKLYQQIRLF